MNSSLAVNLQFTDCGRARRTIFIVTVKITCPTVLPDKERHGLAIAKPEAKNGKVI